MTSSLVTPPSTRTSSDASSPLLRSAASVHASLLASTSRRRAPHRCRRRQPGHTVRVQHERPAWRQLRDADAAASISSRRPSNGRRPASRKVAASIGRAGPHRREHDRERGCGSLADRTAERVVAGVQADDRLRGLGARCHIDHRAVLQAARRWSEAAVGTDDGARSQERADDRFQRSSHRTRGAHRRVVAGVCCRLILLPSQGGEAGHFGDDGDEDHGDTEQPPTRLQPRARRVGTGTHGPSVHDGIDPGAFDTRAAALCPATHGR